VPQRPAISIHRLQKADKLLGFAACALAQPFRIARGLGRRLIRGDVEPRNILAIKFWGIGSLQLLTPAVEALRQDHPDARLTLLTLAENGEFARGLRVFDEVRTVDIRSDSWIAIGIRMLQLVGGLRRAGFDRVYDFEFFTRFSSLISLATSAAALHGFRSPSVWRGGFHTRTVPFNRYWHVARNFRALAGGEDGSEVRPRDVAAFQLDEGTLRGLERQLAAAGLAAGEPFVVVNPNAGRLSLERRWPAASFAVLIRRLIDEDGLSVALIGAPGEKAYTAEVLRLVEQVEPVRTRPAPTSKQDPRAVNLAGAFGQAELCALLTGATVVISNDSGPMHLAAALGAPTVGLFGPETPLMYRPLGHRVRVLYEPPVCSPCINVHDNKVATCIHGRPECLVNISVEAVLSATRSLLASAGADGSEHRSGWRVLPGEAGPGAEAERARG